MLLFLFLIFLLDSGYGNSHNSYNKNYKYTPEPEKYVDPIEEGMKYLEQQTDFSQYTSMPNYKIRFDSKGQLIKVRNTFQYKYTKGYLLINCWAGLAYKLKCDFSQVKEMISPIIDYNFNEYQLSKWCIKHGWLNWNYYADDFSYTENELEQ